MKKKYFILLFLLVQIGIVVFVILQFVDLKQFFPAGTKEGQELAVREQLTIVVPTLISHIDPFAIDDRERLILKNVYEPLVDFDENLRIKPVLATAWGMLSSTEWEFTLRQDVQFHNQKAFGAEDVVFTFETMRERGSADMKSVLSTIESVSRQKEGKIRVTTKLPDPLLLSRLRYLFILPSNLTAEELSDLAQKSTGTGPFQYAAQTNENELTLQKFKDYYKADDVRFNSLRFRAVPSKFARLELLQKKEADVVVSIPTESVESVKNFGYEIMEMPTLESVFLLFNTQHVFGDVSLRQQVNAMVDRVELAKIIGQLGVASSQFASSGVFGYNPELKTSSREAEAVSPLPEKTFWTLKLSSSNQVLSDFLTASLEGYNIKINAEVTDDVALLSDLALGNGDLFLIGWKFSDGDVIDFLNSVVHSRTDSQGSFNGLGYAFSDIDRLIDDSNQQLDQKKRLKLLQEIMQKITEEQFIGIPLFESRTMYAVSAELFFLPSLDGTITYHNFSHL